MPDERGSRDVYSTERRTLLDVDTYRRRLLSVLGGGIATLAGCSGGRDGVGGTPSTSTTASGTGRGTDTATVTATGTDTDGATATTPRTDGGTPGGDPWTDGVDWTVPDWEPPSSCAPESDFGPDDLSLSIATSYHPTSILPPGLLVRGDDFRTEPDADLIGATGGTTSATSVEGGSLVVDGGGEADALGLLRTDARPEVPYAAVVLSVERLPSTETGTRAYAGLATERGDYVAGWYDPRRSEVGIDARVDGDTVEYETWPLSPDAEPPLDFAFVYRGRVAKLFVQKDSGWHELLVVDPTEEIDLRDPDRLSQFRFAYGGGGPGTAHLGAASMGHVGGWGVRDPAVVTWADGTPYVRDGDLYLVLSVAGNDLSNGYMGIFAMDLQSYAIRQTGALFFRRDGRVLSDYAGHVTIDPDDGTAHVLTSSWGDHYLPESDVGILYASGDESILSGVHTLDARRIVDRAYDPYAVRIDGTWWLTAVGLGQIFTARFAGDGFDDYTRVGEGGEHLIEGPRLQRIGDDWYVLAARVDEYQVFSREMERVGSLTATHPSEGEMVNPPHPMLVPLPTDGGNTRYVMVTHDGTFPYAESKRELGSLVVQHADETVCGHVYPFDRRGD